MQLSKSEIIIRNVLGGEDNTLGKQNHAVVLGSSLLAFHQITVGKDLHITNAGDIYNVAHLDGVTGRDIGWTPQSHRPQRVQMPFSR